MRVSALARGTRASRTAGAPRVSFARGSMAPGAGLGLGSLLGGTELVEASLLQRMRWSRRTPCVVVCARGVSMVGRWGGCGELMGASWIVWVKRARAVTSVLLPSMKVQILDFISPMCNRDRPFLALNVRLK